MAKAMSNEEFINRCNIVHNNRYDYSRTKYVNSKTNVIITCPIHGDFEQNPRVHLRGCGCPKCALEKNTVRLTKSIDTFLEQASNIHNNKYDYSKTIYNGANQNVCIICPKHGEFWQTPHNHLRGRGCPKCALEESSKRYAMDIKTFVERANKIHDHKYWYDNVLYKNANTKVEIICPEHGSFWQTPWHHLEGLGCKKCRLKSQYRLQKLLQCKFPEHFTEWEYSPEWLNGQRIDIADTTYKIAIEYNGIQHYEPVEFFGGESAFEKQQIYDCEKEKLCTLNNYTLFKVPYYYNNVFFEDLCLKIQKIIDDYVE